jgi:hypothetical protein
MKRLLAVLWLLCLMGLQANSLAELLESQVLVLYNSQNADSLAVYNYYKSVHPGVLAFDLNDATVLHNNITYADYVTKIRDPLRNYLTTNSLQSQVVCITTTKGLPHRIPDIDNPPAGDSGTLQSNEFTAGDATSASLDSELSLLWQDLNAGEAGGNMDSHADNLIYNPYFGLTVSLSSFSRSTITDTSWDWFNDSNAVWAIGTDLGEDVFELASPGNFYYTTRLDANTVQDVTDMIDRAQNIQYEPSLHKIIFDENENYANFDGDDYGNAAAFLIDSDLWPNDMVISDATRDFLIGQSASVPDPRAVRVDGLIAMLATYGGNHNLNDQDEYPLTYAGQLVNGAIWNSIESLNARSLGTLPEYSDQGSVEEWIAAGGTLAFGNVWEPFAGSIARNRIFVENWFANNLSWVEAAWSSLPYVSWQQVVIGDPLARSNVLIPEPTASMLWLAAGIFLAGYRTRRQS